MPSVVAVSPVQTQGAKPPETRLHKTAREFEAMFMTEMLHHTRSTPKGSGVFAAGSSERSWQVFMDQALGQAAAGQSGTSLTRQIERALQAAQGQRGGGHK